MKIYYHDNLDTDQRLPHEGEPATMKDLEALGMFASHIEDQSEVDRIAEERGYKNRDEVCAHFKQLQLYSWLIPGSSFARKVGRKVSYND